REEHRGATVWDPSSLAVGRWKSVGTFPVLAWVASWIRIRLLQAIGLQPLGETEKMGLRGTLPEEEGAASERTGQPERTDKIVARPGQVVASSPMISPMTRNPRTLRRGLLAMGVSRIYEPRTIAHFLFGACARGRFPVHGQGDSPGVRGHRHRPQPAGRPGGNGGRGRPGRAGVLPSGVAGLRGGTIRSLRGS